MEQKDYWTDTLRRKEKADEDRYFAEQDRKLIEKLHRQRQPAQETEPPTSTSGVPVDRAPLDSAATKAVKP
jgi:hypothetical protein